jgi:hypothetical protein
MRDPVKRGVAAAAVRRLRRFSMAVPGEVKKESASFLKKRSKKLSVLASGGVTSTV